MCHLWWVAHPQQQLLHCQEAGSGTPLVLLPAFPLWSEMWKSQIEELSNDFRVIAVDPRGFGASPPLGDAPPSLDVLAEDVKRLLDHLNIDAAVIAGCSMGGYAALAFLRRHPERVEALILADTRASADTESGKQEREHDAAYVEGAIGKPPEEVSEAIFTIAFPRLLKPDTSTDPALIRQLHEWVGKTDPNSVAWALRAMANRRDAHDVLARATVPVVIIAAEGDEVIAPTESVKMLEALTAKNGHMVLIEGANHLGNLEEPTAFNAAVRTLSALTPTPRRTTARQPSRPLRPRRGASR